MALALAPVQRVRAAEVPLSGRQRDRDRGDERDRREPHVEHQQGDHGERDLQDGEEHDGNGVAHRVGEDRDVAGHAAHQVAGARAFDQVDRHRERVVEHLGAHLREGVLTHDRGTHPAEVPEDRGDDRQHRVRERGAVDRALRVRRVVRDCIDDHTDQRRACQRRDRRRALQQHRDGHAAPPVAQQSHHARAGRLRRRGGKRVVVDGGLVVDRRRGHDASGATRSR